MTGLPEAASRRPPAPQGLRVASAEVIALRDDAADIDLTVIRVTTNCGLVGLGQVEAPSLVIDGIVRCRGGLADQVVGQDPFPPQRLWRKMYAATGYYGRRGAVVSAIGAIETALWDIAGKALGRPAHELLWKDWCVSQPYVGPARFVTPYATVYPPGSSTHEVARRFGEAARRGFRGVKLEPWDGGFACVDAETDAALASLIRRAIGPGRDLMVDALEYWADVSQALKSIRAMEPHGIYFVEAPLAADSIGGYARLAAASSVPIAAGDWGFTTRFEFEDLMDRGGVKVVQPSTVRAGGVDEILSVAEAAHRRGLQCVPHTWCHMLGVAVGVHLAAVVPNMHYIEYPVAYPDSPLVSDLLVPRLEPDQDGLIPVPDRPGLGFDLNPAVIEKYRVQPY